MSVSHRSMSMKKRKKLFYISSKMKFKLEHLVRIRKLTMKIFKIPYRIHIIPYLLLRIKLHTQRLVLQ
jgi:hypothetical protein